MPILDPVGQNGDRTRAINLLTLFAATLTLAAQPLAQLPYAPSLDVNSMDRSVQPCEDFYRYACGGWIKKNPIPSDQGLWNVYAKIAFDNQRFLWGLLEQAAKPTASRTSSEQKVGDYYHACMDEAGIERAGIQPLQPCLDQVGGLKSIGDVSRFVTAQHRLGTGSNLMFGFGSNQDFANAQSVIAFAGRGDLGLPDRDYYTKTDDKGVEIRGRYVDHIKNVFVLLGEERRTAHSHAQQVMAIETELAKSMLTQVELRDAHNLFHRLSREQLKALTPSVNWEDFFTAIGLPDTGTINVTEPAFFQALEARLKRNDIEEWKSFLRWNLARHSSDYL